MRVFVTGGSGFVGGHVIERLVRDGHEVVAMARSDRSAAKVERYGARAVRSSLGEVRPGHIEGCQAIVHAAAFVEEWGTREQFWAINVEGTQQLLDVARACGVSRFIHVGTEAALFDGQELVDIDETHPYPSRQRFLYSETKAEAERRVLAAFDDSFVTISIRPRLVWGPRDASVLPAVLRMVEEGGWTWLDGGRHRTSTCHVENLAHGISLALFQGRGGHAYFVGDQGVRTLRSFLTALAATAGVVLPDRSVPGAVARVAAALVEAAWRMLGRTQTPPLTRFAAAMMSRTITVRTDKAQRELGYRPVVTVEQGLEALGGTAPRVAVAA